MNKHSFESFESLFTRIIN